MRIVDRRAISIEIGLLRCLYGNRSFRTSIIFGTEMGFRIIQGSFTSGVDLLGCFQPYFHNFSYLSIKLQNQEKLQQKASKQQQNQKKFIQLKFIQSYYNYFQFYQNQSDFGLYNLLFTVNKDKYYIFYIFYIILYLIFIAPSFPKVIFDNMLPFLYRIGPLFITQLVFLVIGFGSLLFKQINSCLGFTFIELSSQFFLIEIIVAFKLIQKNKQLRQKYIGTIVFGSQSEFVINFVWNFITIWGTMVGLTYWMVRQGLTLTNTEIENSQKIYTLYPLCYFSDLSDHQKSGKQYEMVMNFLYASTIIVNMFLMTMVIRKFYSYYLNIRNNRSYLKNNSIQYSQSLLDCKLIINQQRLFTKQNQENYQNQQQVVKNPQLQIQCGICLKRLGNQKQKYIKLRCSHFFHQECIYLWLKVKDSCPYRCNS